MPEDLIVKRIDALGQPLIGQMVGIFPSDHLKEKRSANLFKAHYILTAMIEQNPVGVLFIRNIMSIPNATWVVAGSYRRRGIALCLLRQAQKELRFMTAIARNKPSLNLMKKAGFFLFPFGLGVWFKIR